MIAGAILRVEVFSGQRSFTIIAALVLLPIGHWLLLGAQTLARPRPVPTRRHRAGTGVLAAVVGIVGGLYGIGGGSILAPILIALGYSVYEVAPATLTATFLTSVVGIAAYQVLQAVHGGTIAPQWILGAFLGAGGFAGSYCGARLQRRLPERSLRRLLGAIACLVAVRYIQTAVTASPEPRPASHIRTAKHAISRLSAAATLRAHSGHHVAAFLGEIGWCDQGRFVYVFSKSTDLLGNPMRDEQLLEEGTYFAIREEQLVRRLERSGHTRREILKRGAAGALTDELEAEQSPYAAVADVAHRDRMAAGVVALVVIGLVGDR